MKKRKIIIYGGSFDPPHKGHFKLLRAAIKEIKPDKVYVVAGWRSPFKNFPFASYRFSDFREKAGSCLRQSFKESTSSSGSP